MFDSHRNSSQKDEQRHLLGQKNSMMLSVPFKVVSYYHVMMKGCYTICFLSLEQYVCDMQPLN